MTKTNDDIHVNKKYKDTVFRKLFGENGENALSLYNAVNHTSYTDPDDLRSESTRLNSSHESPSRMPSSA